MPPCLTEIITNLGDILPQVADNRYSGMWHEAGAIRARLSYLRSEIEDIGPFDIASTGGKPSATPASRVFFPEFIVSQRFRKWAMKQGPRLDFDPVDLVDSPEDPGPIVPILNELLAKAKAMPPVELSSLPFEKFAGVEGDQAENETADSRTEAPANHSLAPHTRGLTEADSPLPIPISTALNLLATYRFESP